MLIVLSPAKSLDFDTPFKTKLHTTPDFLARSSVLIDTLRAYSPGQLSELMGLSDKLAVLNVTRYAGWSEDLAHTRQAIMAFNGDVYNGFEARSLTPKQLAYAQQHVRILSGLYGVLRPLDLIHPHRLEMGTRLPTSDGKDLYQFWGETVSAAIEQAAEASGAQALVNLASEEYFKSVRPASLSVPVVSPVFLDWSENEGKYKIISFFAKRARGMMARYAAVKGVTDAEKLKKFKVDGYAFDKRASDASSWIFKRRL
jgi:cytoplasmic iron level regulating protein YaaA (DUF328/UPF0246 family)